MTSLEEIQTATDIVSRGGLSLCVHCEKSVEDEPPTAGDKLAAYVVTIVLDGKAYADGPFCRHTASLIRAEVLKFADVESAEVTPGRR